MRLTESTEPRARTRQLDERLWPCWLVTGIEPVTAGNPRNWVWPGVSGAGRCQSRSEWQRQDSHAALGRVAHTRRFGSSCGNARVASGSWRPQSSTSLETFSTSCAPTMLGGSIGRTQALTTTRCSRWCPPDELGHRAQYTMRPELAVGLLIVVARSVQSTLRRFAARDPDVFRSFDVVHERPIAVIRDRRRPARAPVARHGTHVPRRQLVI